MSIQAYQKAAQRAEAPRDTEYRAFAHVTRALIAAKDAGFAADAAAFMDALTRNRRLWEVLATDCADAKNTLPGPVRAQIISLAMFVDRHTSAVCREDADIDTLIEINRTMMEGLAPGAAAGPIR